MILDFYKRAAKLQPLVQLFRKYRFEFGSFLEGKIQGSSDTTRIKL